MAAKASVAALAVFAVVAGVRPVLGVPLCAEVTVVESWGAQGLAEPGPRSGPRADMGIRHGSRAGVSLVIVVPGGRVGCLIGAEPGHGTWPACRGGCRSRQHRRQGRCECDSPCRSKHCRTPYGFRSGGRNPRCAAVGPHRDRRRQRQSTTPLPRPWDPTRARPRKCSPAGANGTRATAVDNLLSRTF